jgi:O-antigen/teichoic acid export membrane protein
LGYSFLARSVSQVDVGAVAGLALLASLFQLLSDFGLSSSLAKFVSELMGRGENPSGYFLSAFVFRASLALALSLLLFSFPERFSVLLFKSVSYSSSVRLLSFDVVLVSLASLLSGFLWGAGRLRVLACCGIASVSARWVAIVLFLLKGFGVWGVVLGWVVGDLVGVALYTVGVSRLRVWDGFTPNLGVFLSVLLRFSLPLYIASLVNFLFSYYDRAVVLAFLPLSDVGVYDVVGKVFGVLVSVTVPFSSALFPYYGSAYGRGERDLIGSAVGRASKYSALVFAPLALGLFSVSRPVLVLFAGEGYEGGAAALSILSLFALVYTVSPALSNLLLIYGRTLTVLLLSLVSVGVSLAALPLLWRFGLCGLAVVKGLSMLSSFALTLWLLSGVACLRFDGRALLKIYCSAAVMTLAVLLVERVWYSAFLLPFYVVVGAAFYALSLRFLSVLDDQDALLLERVFGARVASIACKLLYRRGVAGAC